MLVNELKDHGESPSTFSSISLSLNIAAEYHPGSRSVESYTPPAACCPLLAARCSLYQC